MPDTAPPPDRPKHVPFWPWLVAFAFLVAVVVAGTIASDRHRDATATSTTTELPSTVAPTSTTAPTTPAVAASICTPDGFLGVVTADHAVSASLVPDLRPRDARCVDGYGYVFVDVAHPDREQVAPAFFQAVGGHWKLLAVGEVGDGTQIGLPVGMVARLTK